LQDPNRPRRRVPSALALAYHAARVRAKNTAGVARRSSAPPAAASGDDPIFALNAEAERRRAAGEEVVNSTLGTLLDDDGRLAVIPAVGEAYRRIPWERGAAYAPISGPERFLEAVAADLFAEDPLARAAVCVATPGGTGALALAVGAFVEAGERVLTTSYHWSPYETIATHAGRELATFPTFGADGRFDAGALEDALARTPPSQGRALVLLNTPCHNPSGYSLDDDDWSALGAALERAAARRPLTVLLDLAYARYADDPHAWRRHVAPLLGRVTWVLAWSASKAFAQYGARVGACVVLSADAEERARVRTRLGLACRGTWSNGNHLGMLVVAECLRDPELSARVARERGVLRALLSTRAEAFVRLAREAGLAHPRHDGGFFTLVPCPDAEDTARVMRARGVYVVPLPGAVRIALCSTPARALPRLVETLAAARRGAEEPEPA
jgi:aromatic-amino-acid transaminase